MKNLRILIAYVAMCVMALSAKAQNHTQQITAIQYYFDTDPGVGEIGNGAIVPVTPGASINQTFNIVLPGSLSEGFHSLLMRAKDEFGQWSIAERRSFYIVNNISTSQNIAAIQYYFESDPGVGIAGNGGIIPVSPASSITQSLAINIPGTLTTGFHILCIRTMDESGRWSITERRSFYVFSTSTQNINAYQYYFDSDPGVGVTGNGAIVPVTPGSTFNQMVAINLQGTLTNDYHYLFLRTRDESGSWSIAERRAFVVGICAETGADSTVAWWPFEDSTNVATDIAGNHDGISLNGQSKIGYAVFDGTDDYIGVPDNDSWAFGTNDFSIEFLASFSSPGGDASTRPGDKIIGQSEGLGINTWTLALGGGQLFLRVNATNYVETPFSPVINQWYHLALTRSGDTLRMFINGLLSGTQVVSNLLIPNINSPLGIGWVDWVLAGDQGFMTGSLDEMTLYHRALLEQEITIFTLLLDIHQQILQVLHGKSIMLKLQETNLYKIKKVLQNRLN